MNDKTALVVTSIASPNAVLRALAQGCREQAAVFIVIGDQASPPDFQLDGCDFYGLDAQHATDLAFARLCPTHHYSRKNIGYLLAARLGAQVIVETDDDNFPNPSFWQARRRVQDVAAIEGFGWLNVYRYFSDANIWPRGLPLDCVRRDVPAFESLDSQPLDCPIQQGLSDENPDVDAIFRLTGDLPQSFRNDRRVALGRGAWCPFNSQNTTWWAAAFPLLYLPSHCSFRVTDIWRSFVAQRIAWENDWSLLFHEPTMRQERNAHDLMRDFQDEIPGYLHNAAIAAALSALDLRSGVQHIPANLLACYEMLAGMKLVAREEIGLVEAWLDDFAGLPKASDD